MDDPSPRRSSRVVRMPAKLDGFVVGKN
ncbi:hypothetical protein CCACVL1_18612 [Corchorus capsularis]|uniref:Uncharacterized protein n=1 Tax=Corchorus capsularis TaxID=210143 RepID=A0A1R3G138_COCAP|nr:hypothetical protein CCACVL1_29601 [Corchorus capsularis]OMO62149.1 hypothetical protein CCACVL1_22996 [Corchorus capsularis]OMO70870.1 hypothetical protein CCACVL1_18612 [Corchorus capsularis]